LIAEANTSLRTDNMRQFGVLKPQGKLAERAWKNCAEVYSQA
jgi:hypothetical protein